MSKSKLPTLEPTEPKLKLGRPTEASRRHNDITRRIMELDDDVQTLRERREWGFVSVAEARQYTRLIKLFEETIKVLQEAL